jgi:hypothetical protein
LTVWEITTQQYDACNVKKFRLPFLLNAAHEKYRQLRIGGKARCLPASLAEIERVSTAQTKPTRRIQIMETCSQCRNVSDRTFQVTKNGRTYKFDSFDCAIQALAFVCPYCHCRIMGVGVEASGEIYCSQQCAVCDQTLRGNFNPFRFESRVNCAA